MSLERLTVTCPVCGRPGRGVTRSGKIRAHNDPSRKNPWLAAGVVCAGSGQVANEGRYKLMIERGSSGAGGRAPAHRKQGGVMGCGIHMVVT